MYLKRRLGLPCSLTFVHTHTHTHAHHTHAHLPGYYRLTASRETADLSLIVSQIDSWAEIRWEIAAGTWRDGGMEGNLDIRIVRTTLCLFFGMNRCHISGPALTADNMAYWQGSIHINSPGILCLCAYQFWSFIVFFFFGLFCCVISCTHGDDYEGCWWSFHMFNDALSCPFCSSTANSLPHIDAKVSFVSIFIYFPISPV